MWALIESMPIEGDIGVQAKAEVKKLGIDVKAKCQDIRRLVGKFFHGSGVDPEDALQEVLLAILLRNNTPSAFNPEKSSFSHYVILVAKNAISNLREKVRRWDREGGVQGGVLPDCVDHRDPIDAWLHVEASPRVSRDRPLQRDSLTPGRGVFN